MDTTTLMAKVQEIAENYADLVAARIKAAKMSEFENNTIMSEINDGIRILNHVAATLERINRLSCETTKLGI